MPCKICVRVVEKLAWRWLFAPTAAEAAYTLTCREGEGLLYGVASPMPQMQTVADSVSWEERNEVCARAILLPASHTARESDNLDAFALEGRKKRPMGGIDGVYCVLNGIGAIRVDTFSRQGCLERQGQVLGGLPP
jgi:hypothetical protein